MRSMVYSVLWVRMYIIDRNLSRMYLGVGRLQDVQIFRDLELWGSGAGFDGGLGFRGREPYILNPPPPQREILEA